MTITTSTQQAIVPGNMDRGAARAADPQSAAQAWLAHFAVDHLSDLDLGTLTVIQAFISDGVLPDKQQVLG